MVKTIILLTKSKKYNNYCIAGIDYRTGEWIRLISEDVAIHNAVPSQDLTYINGHEAQVLDIVDVKIKKHAPYYYQPENHVYFPGQCWTKVGRSTPKQVLKLCIQQEDQYVFHNTDKRLSRDFVQSLRRDTRYSLKLISPQDIILHAKQWQPDQQMSYSASFRYNNRSYSYFRITDEKFTAQYPDSGNYRLDSVAFVISLAGLYERDGCHYKLIASIIPY